MQDDYEAIPAFSDRLRELKDELKLTTAAMSEKTGIPKKTLDKYLAKNSQAQPSIHAIRALCRGLTVEADWLLGLEASSYSVERESLITERAAQLVIEQFLATAISLHRHAEKKAGIPVIKDGKMFGAFPAELAADCAARIMKLRSEMDDDPKLTPAVAFRLSANTKPMNLDPEWPFEKVEKTK